MLLTVDTVLSLPLVKAVGACAALLTAGWFAKDYATRLENSTEKISASVDKLATEFTVFRNDIKRDLDARTADRFTRTEHKLWTYELEKQNAGRIIVPPLPPMERHDPRLLIDSVRD